MRSLNPLWAICILAALSLLGVGPLPQGEQASLRIEPAEISVAPGTTFTVEVVGAGVTDLAGFEVSLTFNPAVVQLDDVTLGDFLESTGRSALAVGPDVDEAAGRLRFGGFTFGENSGASGSGVLAVVSLSAVSVGTSPVAPEEAKLVDTGAAALNVTTAGGRVVVRETTATATAPPPTESVTATPAEPPATSAPSEGGESPTPPPTVMPSPSGETPPGGLSFRWLAAIVASLAIVTVFALRARR